MKNRKNYFLGIVLLSFAITQNLFSDQHFHVSEAIAKKAFSLLQNYQKLYFFCEPCGDKTAKETGVSNYGYNPIRQGNSYVYEVTINNKPIDLAYTYFKYKNRWKNVANHLGLTVSGNPKFLTQNNLPVNKAKIAATTISNIPYLSVLEKQVIEETNLARTKPKVYAKILAKRRKYFDGKLYKVPNKVPIITNEGVRSLNEAINFLNSVKPLQPLSPSKGLSLAAKDHANDTGLRGMTGHSGSDGSSLTDRINRYGQWKIYAGENVSYGQETARKIVIQLIVDDGVYSRGHRNNIFNPKFNKIGVGYGTHSRYEHMCVQDFAGDYIEKK